MKIAKSVETYKEEKKIPNMQVEIGKEFVNLLKTFESTKSTNYIFNNVEISTKARFFKFSNSKQIKNTNELLEKQSKKEKTKSKKTDVEKFINLNKSK